MLTALRRGFAAAAKAQGKDGNVTLQQKAVIFTESRRTQDYLFQVLEQTEFKGKVMIFNGVNNDPGSKAIYQKWAGETRWHRPYYGLADRRSTGGFGRSLP